MERRAHRTILLATGDRMPFGIDPDENSFAFALLSVPGLAQALAVMRAGVRPDAVIIERPTAMSSIWEFVRELFEESSWRHIPVLLTGDPDALFQLAPRGRERKLPAPSNLAQLRALVDYLVDEGQRHGASSGAPEP